VRFYGLWHVRNYFIFKKIKFFVIHVGYPFGYPLDPYVVLSLAGGAMPRHGYWVQPFGNGSTQHIQPIRLAV
jgi:hypothetical protein